MLSKNGVRERVLANAGVRQGFTLRRQRSQVRILSGAPLRYKTGNAETRRFCACSGDERGQQYAFGAHEANFFRIDLDALGECAEVIATVAAALGAHALSSLPGECFERLRGDARPDRILGALCVSAGLIADRLRAISLSPARSQESERCAYWSSLGAQLA
jgi:hypothetical protein